MPYSLLDPTSWFSANQANDLANNVDYTPGNGYLGFGNNMYGGDGTPGSSQYTPGYGGDFLDPAITGGTAQGILNAMGPSGAAWNTVNWGNPLADQALGVNQVTPATNQTYLPGVAPITTTSPSNSLQYSLVNGAANILNSPQGLLNTVAGTNFTTPGMGWLASGLVNWLGGPAGTGAPTYSTTPGAPGTTYDFSNTNAFGDIGGGLMNGIGSVGATAPGLAGLGNYGLGDVSAGIYGNLGAAPAAPINYGNSGGSLPLTPGVPSLPAYSTVGAPYVPQAPETNGGLGSGSGFDPQGNNLLPPFTVADAPFVPQTPTTPANPVTTPTPPITQIDPPSITTPDVTIPGTTTTNPSGPSTPTTPYTPDLGVGAGGGNGGVGTTSTSGDRNALNEGLAQNYAEAALAPQQLAQYNAYSNANAAIDARNLGTSLFGAGGPSTIAGQYAALTAGQQDPLLQQQNAIASGLLAQGGNLSPSELRNVQQSSRAGFAARGLGATNASVVDEAMQTDAQRRARLLQNMGIAQNVVGQNQAQTGLINANNASLFGLANGMTTASNAYTRNQFDPFSNYGMDLANTNYNAGQARNIAANNNALALTIAGQNADAAKSAATTSTLGNIFGAWLGRCWVAREVYGVDSIKWRLFRHWLETQAPQWFVKCYDRYGPGFAQFLKTHPRIKYLVRLWMDKKVESTVQELAHGL